MKALLVIVILIGAALFALMSVVAFYTSEWWLDLVVGTAFALISLVCVRTVWSKLRTRSRTNGTSL